MKGVFRLAQEDLEKPASERYVHAVLTLPEGRKIIVTGNPFLLSLVHNATMIQVDTTFKRTFGELDEWEVVMWEDQTSRSKSSIMTYIPRR